MEPGFVKADSDNLPCVDMEMITTFYIHNLQFISAEMRNEKAKRASKEAYGDNAVSYVQLKRDGYICKVKCRITPEHKIHKKGYNVVVIINEKNQKVISCECSDCVASLGGCKHAVAFLFWLHRRSEEPSVTSKECYWKASKLSKVGKSEKFMSLAQITGKETVLKPKSAEIRDNFIKSVEKQKGGVFEFYSSSDLDKFDIYQLILRYKADISEADYSPEKFITYAQQIMGDDFSQVEEETREQASSSKWYEMRFGRITASKIYEAARCKTAAGALMESIMGASKHLETEAISRGKRLEPFVIKEVEKLKKIKIHKVGLLLNSEFLIFGASPDGLSKDYCIEVKCPSTEKAIENYIKHNIINKKYYFQLQMQMLFANKKKGLFCVASPKFEEDKEVYITEVEIIEEDIREIIMLAFTFWKTYVYDNLMKM